jgi:hypothetical protein
MAKNRDNTLGCVTLKMKAIESLESQVTVYQSTQHHIPEDLNLEV